MPEILFRTTRHLAIAEGLLIDANQGEFAAVSREHFPHHHLAMTEAVFVLLDRAAERDADRSPADLWRDVLRMSQVCPVRLLLGGHTFNAGLRAGGTPQSHELKILFHGGDYGEPCATVMLLEEGRLG